MNKNFLWVLLLIPFNTWAAATTITGNGNWSDNFNWAGGNIADSITEDVEIAGIHRSITILNGETYTIGAINMNSDNTLTIDEGGRLSIGNSDSPYNLTGNTNTTLNVNGSLTIWGNLEVENELNINVGTNGSLTIMGNLELGNECSIDIQGRANIEGDFIGRQYVRLHIDGVLELGGSYNVLLGSTASGSGTSNHNGCIGPASFCGSTTLPVDLINFEISSNNNQVVIEWQTASELNNEYFSIERSTDGWGFSEIGRVDGNGTISNITKYQFIDNKMSNGNMYYRLKQVDFDGSFHYSQVKSINIIIEKSDFFNVYPNPVDQGNSLKIVYRTIDKKVCFKLSDLKGKIIWNKTIVKEGFSNTIKLETKYLPKGILFLNMICNNHSHIKRIILN